MTKKELRRFFLEKRRRLTDAEQDKLDDLLLIRFQAQPLPPVRTVFSYRPITENREPATELFTRYLSFRNPSLVIAYPRTDPRSNRMEAIIANAETTFKGNAFGVEEPVTGASLSPRDIDLVIVPLLAYDRRGFRVGYGKGYYDRYLAGCRADCIKAGFSYFDPVDEITDKAGFDVPLNLCITPQTVYVF